MADIDLKQSGEGWAGSFGLALEAFVADILSDGTPEDPAPFRARITWDDGDGEQVADVKITDLVDGQLWAHPLTKPILTIDILRLEA